MASMNAGIILQGQQPNFLGTIQQANQAAAQQNQFQQQNALSDLYREQGPAIAQGEQGALNALAQFDPKAALGIQGQRQNMEINQEELQIRRQTAARQAESWATQQDDRTKAEAAAEIKRGLMAAGQAFNAGDEAAFNRILQENGVEPFPMAEFPYKAAEYEGVLAALEGAKQFGKPPAPDYGVTDGQFYDKNNPGAGAQPIPGMAPKAESPLSAPGKLGADLKAGRISQEQYNAAMQKSGLRVSVGPNGETIFEQGPGVTGAQGLGKPTEGQLAGAGYLQRMTGSEGIIRDLEGQGVNAIPLAKAMALDTAVEGYVLSADEASLAQAQRDWVRAKLRKESGAVIADEEMASEIKTYFPLPGEGQEIIAQKREARRRAERQMQIGSGSAAGMAGELSPGTESQPGVEAMDFSTMSDEELQAFIERGGK